MATLQQKSTARKFIYFGLILALFTVSFAHRKFIIDVKAADLGLREIEKGEADLTDEAVRLGLTGVRGVMVCILWNVAIEQQKRHEWNNLENTVQSLTTLQPHFISPWLFQSWNLAFNVAVECDRPRDKYYYIVSGIDLLAKGERRNQGNNHLDPEKRTPASPDLRYHMGVTYQLKIGQGDEQRYLRSLFDLSCIDPLERDANRLMAAGQEGEEVDPVKFRKFCEDHPRLVRRLREQLGMASPKAIVTFLKDNKAVASRFNPPTDSGARQSLLKPPLEQFPCLPPNRLDDTWPNPDSPNFDDRDVDVFNVMHAWYGYAQQPLPPPDPEFGRDPKVADEWKKIGTKYRLAKNMAVLIFRTYPARSQAYIAESLQNDGWFDGSGWPIREWFDGQTRPTAVGPTALQSAAAVSSLASLGQQGPWYAVAAVLPGKSKVNPSLVVGRGLKYDSGVAWQKAYDLYLDYAAKNGLHLSPEQWATLEKQIAEGNATAKKDAQRKKGLIEQYRGMTNLEAWLDQTLAEKSTAAVQARKKFSLADSALKNNERRLFLELQKQALNDWIKVLLAYRGFGKINHIQEDAFEQEQTYLRVWRRENKAMVDALLSEVAQTLADGVAQLASVGPRAAMPLGAPPLRLVTITEIYGPLDRVFWRDVKNEPLAIAALLAVGQGTVTPVVPLDQLTRDKVTLSIRASRWSPPGPEWTPLIYDDIIHAQRNRPLIVETPAKVPAGK